MRAWNASTSAPTAPRPSSGTSHVSRAAARGKTTVAGFPWKKRHATDRHRRQPHPRQLRPRPRRGAATRARCGRGATGRHRRVARAFAQGARTGAGAPGRAVRDRGRAPAPCDRIHRRMRRGTARAARACARRGRGRMRAGLLPRFLAAPGATQGVRTAIADRRRPGRGRRPQAAVPAPARRARGFHGDHEAVRRHDRPGRGALLHRHAHRTVRRPGPGLARRHHRLAVRRTPRCAPARTGAFDPGEPADGRDRRALPAAAQPRAAAEGPAQRTGVPAAHRRGTGARSRRNR